MNKKEQLKKIIPEDKKISDKIIDLYLNNFNSNEIIEFLELGILDKNKKQLTHKQASAVYDQSLENYFFSKIKNKKGGKYYQIYDYIENDNRFIIILKPSKEIRGVFVEFLNEKITAYDYFDTENKIKDNKPNTAAIYYSIKNKIFEYLVKNNLGKFQIEIIREVTNFTKPFGTNFIRNLIPKVLKNKIFETTNKKDFEKYFQINYKKEILILDLLNKENKNKVNKNLTNYFN
jgi:hypothetical protein